MVRHIYKGCTLMLEVPKHRGYSLIRETINLLQTDDVQPLILQMCNDSG